MNEKQLRELDNFCAKDVMLYEPHPKIEGGYYGERSTVIYKFTPTTNPADAFEVLKKCIQKHGQVNLSEVQKEIKISGVDKKWGVEAYGKSLLYEEEITIELAICLFAQKLFTK